MGKFISVFLAFIAISLNVQIFRETQDAGPGPLLSTYTFIFAFILLLWDLTLYPTSLRRLGYFAEFCIEFLIAAFLTESIMTDFWFPLEKVVMDISPKTADLIDDMLSTAEQNCEMLCDILRNQYTGYLVSYMLSISFLVSVLHATRIIDLRTLKQGSGCFFADIVFRLKCFWEKTFASANIDNMETDYGDIYENSQNDVNPSIAYCTCRNRKRSNRRSTRRSKKMIQGKRRTSSSRDRSQRKRVNDCLDDENGDNSLVLGKLRCNIL